MNKLVRRNIIIAVACAIVQIAIFRNLRINFGGISFYTVFLFPVAVMLLPLTVNRNLVIVLGFIMGLCIDLFYRTPGIHAFCLTLCSYIRPYLIELILDDIELRSNYNSKKLEMNIGSFIIYSLIFLFIYSLIFYVLENFTFHKFGIVLLKSVVTTVLSFFAAFAFYLIDSRR